MKHFRIIYEKTEKREVYIDVEDHVTEDMVNKMFWDNFEKYDDESDDMGGCGETNLLMTDEVDEDGNEV